VAAVIMTNFLVVGVRPLRRAVLLIPLLIGAAMPVDAGECFADWGQAGEIVRREKLRTVEQLRADPAGSVGGDILKTTLCKEDDDYVYRLVIRTPFGQLKTLMLRAKAPEKP
jgi:hypothetical protein